MRAQSIPLHVGLKDETTKRQKAWKWSLTLFQTEISANFKFCHLGLELLLSQGPSMRFGHHFNLLVVAVWNTIKTCLNSPFVHNDWTFTWSAPWWGSVTFLSKKKHEPRNKLLLSVCLPVRSAEWIHKPSNLSHPQPLRAHPLHSPGATQRQNDKPISHTLYGLTESGR